MVHHVKALDPCDVTTVNGLRVRPNRAGARRARIGREGRATRATSAHIRTTSGSRPSVTRGVANRLHRPGQAGTGVLLRLLDNIPWEGQLPATWFEELLASASATHRSHRWCCSTASATKPAWIVARPDIAFPSVMLGLEAHSREFHFGPIAEALDEERDMPAASVRMGADLSRVARGQAARREVLERRQGADRGVGGATSERAQRESDARKSASTTAVGRCFGADFHAGPRVTGRRCPGGGRGPG